MPRRIRLVTFNVWFGEHARGARQEALLSLLQSLDADVIGLQEATPELVERIEQTAWLRDYEISDRAVHPHGLLCMSRLPVRSFVRSALPSMFGREILIAELDDLAVGIVHLESTRGFGEQRRRQLAQIFPQLERYPSAVLMGDFNLCSTWDENDYLDATYTDVWAFLHPDAAGWTEDTEINRMRHELTAKHKQVRFDRVLLRSPEWLPAHIELLGTSPVSDDTPSVFISDHFGLCARLERRERSAES
jgi:tyrosyl-DNA phosphodiesterase 2